jgi:hypothetical protein
MTKTITLFAAALIATTTLLLAHNISSTSASPHVFETASEVTPVSQDILPVQEIIFMEPLFFTAGQPVDSVAFDTAHTDHELEALPAFPIIHDLAPVIEMEPMIIRVNVPRDTAEPTDNVIEMAPMHIIVDAHRMAASTPSEARIEGVPVA